MSKALKPKKSKVPKISEEEYAAYLSALKSMTEGVDGANTVENVPSNSGKKV